MRDARLPCLLCLRLARRPAPVGCSGGWKPPHRAHTREALAAWQALPGSAARQRCPIERVAWGSITADEFERGYVHARKPVLFTGAAKAVCSKPRHWTRRGLLGRHGATTAAADTGCELAQHGGRSDRKLALSELVAQFGSEENADNEFFVLDPKLATHFSRSFAEPRLFRSFAEYEESLPDAPVGPASGSSWKRLSLGGDGVGLGLHAHAQFWLGLIHGHKRWLLFPPGRLGGNSTQSALVPNRMLGVPGLLRQLEGLEVATEMHDCVQGPSELLYVPTGWTHATMNLGKSE